MAFLKPQSPLIKGNDYFYPLTTADQVIMDGGYRLDQIVGKVEKSAVTLYQNGWSAAAPYSYSIVVNGLADDLNMQVFPHYSEDFAEKQALKEEFAKVSFCSRQGNIVTFECWDEVPNVDIDVDIEVNVMYPIEMALEEEVESRLPKLNYSIVGGTTQPSNPTENMIWVETDQIIKNIHIIKNLPSDLSKFSSGDILIYNDDNGTYGVDLKISNIYMYFIYPTVIQQYVNGKFINLTGKIYQNNQWNNIDDKIYLFNKGNECIDMTGGWITSSASLYGITPYNDGKALVVPSSDNKPNYCVCTNFNQSTWGTIKGKGYQYLCIEIDEITIESSGSPILRISSDSQGTNGITEKTFSTTGLHYLSIANITTGYVSLAIYNATYKVSKVYFAKSI